MPRLYLKAANALAWIFACGLTAPALAEVSAPRQAEFDTSFLQGGSDQVDLALLLAGSHVLPGNYRVDIYLNQSLFGRRDIDFFHSTRSGQVEPCLPGELLTQMGISADHLSQPPQACADLSSLIEYASTSYDPTQLRLDISVPQAALRHAPRGEVDPSLWDAGVPAAFSNYQFSAQRSDIGEHTSSMGNLNLRSGLNIGPWRLRNQANLGKSQGSHTSFISNQTYLQRDIDALKSQFSLGEIYSDSQLFDSVRYRGIKLAADEGMYADSQRGYAPVIRGSAQTQATVEIRQNGFLLYSRNVAPGPFELTDLYPSGTSGDLEITVIEADGRRQTTVQPFASLPLMVREGQLDYSLSAGRYAEHAGSEVHPDFISASTVYGLGSDLTGAFGTQMVEGFQALALGMGKNTAYGAVSLDLTHSHSEVDGLSHQGNSLRARYARTFTRSATTFSLASYRYSTEGYRTLSEHVHDLSGATTLASSSARMRTDLSVSQSLGRQQQYGSLYLNASHQKLWGGSSMRSLSAGYSHHWRGLNYSLNFTHSQNSDAYERNSQDTQVFLSLSLPLGSQPRAPRATFNSTWRNNGHSNQAGISGDLADNGNTTYALQAGSDGNGAAGSLSLNHRTPVVELGASYSTGADFNALAVNASGSLVAHPGGVNLGPTLGDTFALVHVPDVPGVAVNSHADNRTAGNGYAIVPNTLPYRVNWLSLDTRDLGGEVDIENATQQVVPRRGAVVLARFAGSSGRRVQFELFDAQGQTLPFGTILTDADGTQLAISDPTGKALALLQKDAGELTLAWGGHSCQALYRLPPPNPSLNYQRLRLQCRATSPRDQHDK